MPDSQNPQRGAKYVRRFYQESWLGIPFTTFARVSFFHIADSRFYSAFYEELFRRHKSWQNLPADWLKTKKSEAEWLIEQLGLLKAFLPARELPLRVLSIGSGTGYMEKIILDQFPDIELYVNEPSTVGMKWLRKFIPADRIFIGMPPACLPADLHYNFIYLSAVDYALPNRAFLHLLEGLKAQLLPGGELICLSASLLLEDSFIGGLVNSLKNVIRCAIHFLGIRPQQFWGWRRTRKEYRKILKDAGFNNISEGKFNGDSESFWIKGKK